MGGGVVSEVEDNGRGVADVMVLAGRPIGAPVVAQGTMVMNTPGEVSVPGTTVHRPPPTIQHSPSYQVTQAYEDYQRGMFGIPWDHELDDASWVEQVAAMAGRMGR